MMKIVWDEAKRQDNLIKRSLDFAALMEFFAASVVFPAKKGRFKAVGRFGDTILAVIFAPLGREGVAVISMRKASRKERKAHDQFLQPAGAPPDR
jgi:uncharacterized DUF497 family protein